MAAIKIDGKTVPAKKQVIRNPVMLDEKYVGEEPRWDTAQAELLGDEEFDHLLRQAFRYYNYFFSCKEMKKYAVQWMARQKEYTKANIKTVDRVGDKVIPITAFSLLAAHSRGMPFRGRHLEYIKHHIARAVKQGTAEDHSEGKIKPRAVVQPTIQDRLDEKTREQIGEMEHQFDLVTQAKSSFKAFDWLTAERVPQSQLAKFELVLEYHEHELTKVQNKEDDQLVEGYSQYRAADIKRMLVWISQVKQEIEQYRGVKKAVKKIRAPRPVSKEKLVAKLKYAKENRDLKLVSVNPADIIGAKTLWVYDVKKRKLGTYIADEIEGPLTVKGTTIVGFSPSKSVCKTLRKPADALKEFAKATKPQLRKFLQDINTTPVELSGRINGDVILLKVD